MSSGSVQARGERHDLHSHEQPDDWRARGKDRFARGQLRYLPSHPLCDATDIAHGDQGGMAGTCTSCGHAAQVRIPTCLCARCALPGTDGAHQIMALYAIMSPGDTIVCSKHLYGGTIQQASTLSQSLPN
eukprot:1950673-Rhodomonas_salina.2